MPIALVLTLGMGIFAVAVFLIYDLLNKKRRRHRRSRHLKQWVNAQQRIRYREIEIRMPDRQ
jgi:hypothetical protein